MLLISLALLLSTVISLQDFSSDWTLEVVATVPESFTLQSLTINMMRGSVRTDGDFSMEINTLRIELCNAGESSVALDGLKLSQSASVCATDAVTLSYLQLTDGSSVDVTSLGGSATVSSKVPFSSNG